MTPLWRKDPDDPERPGECPGFFIKMGRFRKTPQKMIGFIKKDVCEMEQALRQIQENIQTVIVGQKRAITLLLTAFIAGGHVLIEDVPGMGKTVLARSLAKSVNVRFGRVQFTPDLLPTDVTGLNFFDRKREEFVFHKGPVFCNILLADEINRATPRTQSSLLECMAERQVTVDGETRLLDAPFFVIATQNPVETLGTYPLPEAQLDRFLMRVSMDPPTKAEEVAILQRFYGGEPLEALTPVCNGEDVRRLQAAARKVFVHPALMEYMAALAGASRKKAETELGVSPRGTLALMRASQAYALISGREYAVPEDVKAVAIPVMAHRISISGMAGSSLAQKQAVEELLRSVEVPTERWES